MSTASFRRPIASALILAFACSAASPVTARDVAPPAERVRPVQTVEREPSAPAAAWAAGTAPMPDCTRARRKLWQAGEGWIVKTITICH